MSENSPDWLNRMQNGVLGEARARAFLVNRFWVLERSVDVHGADFLIQRNALQQSVLDQRPPRFGVVQAKFVMSENTEIRIPSEYMFRSNSDLAAEFFLIVSTGYADDERMFLLSAEDIATQFVSTVRNDKEVYAFSAAAILRGANFEVTGARYSALSRIDDALREADYVNNRSYLFGLGFGGQEQVKIDPDFRLPLENNFGSISDYFDTLKRHATTSLYSLEEAAAPLNTIVESSDPMMIEQAIGELGNLVNADGALWLEGGRGLQVDDVMEAVREHKATVERARAADALGALLTLLDRVRKEFGQFVTDNVSDTPPGAVHLSAEYDPATLRLVKLSIRAEPEQCSGEDDHDLSQCRVINSIPGHQEICLRGSVAFRPDPLTQDVRTNAWMFRTLLQRIVNEQSFG